MHHSQHRIRTWDFCEPIIESPDGGPYEVEVWREMESVEKAPLVADTAQAAASEGHDFLFHKQSGKFPKLCFVLS